MDAILKALVYLLAGLALLTINLWFARAVWNAIAEPAPVVIAPFEVVGRDDAGGKLGTALATMLLARLGRIREEMNASALELRAVRQREDDRRDPAIQTLDADVRRPEIPERLFAPLDLTMTVGGVEVGGMITWLHRALARDNLLQVAVHYDGDRAVAVAHVGGRSEHLLWLQTRGANDEVVSPSRTGSSRVIHPRSRSWRRGSSRP